MKQYFIERRGLAANQMCADSLSMSCSQRPAPQTVIKLIEEMCGHRLTQREWHGIKTLAETESYDCSRRLASTDDAEAAAEELGNTLIGEWRNADFDDEDAIAARSTASNDLLAADTPMSTVAVMRYLADNGLQSTLERLHPELAGLPRVRQFAEVTHIGTFETKDRKDWSLEGDGLSVSINPDAWGKILKEGVKPRWTLARTDGKPLQFLDAHALTNEQLADIANWGCEAGIVTPITAYTVTTFDDELDDDLTATYATREEAVQESYDPDDVEEITTLAFTSERPRGANLGNTEDILLTLWVEQNTNHDGVWWQDKLDPDVYSAPRGVILPSRLPKMARVSK